MQLGVRQPFAASRWQLWNCAGSGRVKTSKIISCGIRKYLIFNGIFLVSKGCGTGICASEQFLLALGIVQSPFNWGFGFFGGRYESLGSSKFIGLFGVG